MVVVVVVVVVVVWGLAYLMSAMYNDTDSRARKEHKKDDGMRNPSGPWVGPRGPEGPKIFFRLRMLRFDLVQFGHFHEGRLQKMLRGGGCFGPFPSTPVGEITSSDPDLSDSDRTESGL